MTTTAADFVSTTTWQNIAATVTEASAVDVSLQNKGDLPVYMAFGGSQPTAEDAGTIVAPGVSVRANDAALWVRSASGTDKINVTLI